MEAATASPAVVRGWAAIPKRIRKSIHGLKAADLAVRGGPEGWSIRETVHHLVEANFIASHIVLAALGKPGCTYDWSWVMPDLPWMKRLGYDRAPVEPSLRLLEALTRHVSTLLKLQSTALKNQVGLLDAPGKRPRRTTVAKLLHDEISHATHHLGDVEVVKQKTAGKKARHRRLR